MTALPPPGSGSVTLRLAGSFAVVRDGVAADARSIGSRKARLLLQLLAVHRGRVLPVDRLAETLWGDDPPSRPAENVATIVSRLRSALGPAAIVGGRDGYRLGDVAVDLDEAGALVQEARRRLDAGEPALAAVAATRALDLVGDGTALTQEPYADWAEPARVEAGALVRQAWSVAAEAALATDDPATAVAVAGTAVAADATDEAAGRLLMRALVASGEPARALTAYEQLRANWPTSSGSTRRRDAAAAPGDPARGGARPSRRRRRGRPAPGWSSVAGGSGGRDGQPARRVDRGRGRSGHDGPDRGRGRDRQDPAGRRAGRAGSRARGDRPQCPVL